ncbi:endonuclease/exonuclease/phosphatase family protein [Sporocytophaga myxococcoides]|uniref:endonuclease/exonuclease/phosphatase family protein n=1 Tax=Sporocytophaga myxococcoides TaxID=153721 RepID=UPI0003F78219|nr:endonuclease/exonuclease/phosphatase family protein [Sporocytophaga myxococcoides]
MKVSIASFNVENLITAEKSIYRNTWPQYTAEQYPKKVDWIRNQLLNMNADIIGFQEIFEEEALRDCLKGTHMEKWNLYVAKPTGNLPVNAILSKFPIVNTEVIEDIPFKFEFFDDRPTTPLLESSSIYIPISHFSRGVLKAEIKLNDSVSLIVFVLHLKSKRPIYREGVNVDAANYPEKAIGSIRSLIRRGIEAAGIRHLVSDEIARDCNKPLVVLGDLNDDDTSVTNQAIIGEPPFRKLKPEEKIKLWQQVLQNVIDVQARKSIDNFHYTYIHNGHIESLDNIFVSNHFADLNSAKIGRIIDVRAYNDHVIDNTVSMDKKPFYVSDHGQIVVNMLLFDRINWD